MSELYHYGVKGMKWGVRKARASRKAAKIRKKHTKAMARTTSAKYTYKQRKLLSDDELRNRINRINMENQLRQLSKSKRPLSDFANDTLKSGKVAAASALGKYGAKVVVGKTVGPEAAAFINPKKK